MQIISQHFAEERLLSLARSLELEMPWPLVAANAPC
jgi:Asp-tRNA(Asn)/Glu-tRNA(Gln) amidotransferase A subunit family amidase